MRNLLAIAGALSCALFLGLAIGTVATPAQAQHIIDPAVVHAPTLFNPSPAPGASFATPTAFVPDGEVIIPWGDLVGDALGWLLGLVGVIAAALLRKLPASIVAVVDNLAGTFLQKRASELLELAITYGINTTEGAVRGKTMTVNVGLEVLERALEYAVRHAPGLIASLGGIVSLREKIIARLDLEPAAQLPSPKPPAETLVVEPVAPSPVAAAS